MTYKYSDGNILIEWKTVRHKWAEYFDELLNVLDSVQASVVAVGCDRIMPVFGRLIDRGGPIIDPSICGNGYIASCIIIGDHGSRGLNP